MAEVTPKKPSRLAAEIAAVLPPGVPPVDEKLLVNAALHVPATLPVGRTLQMISILDLKPSPTNPRQTFTGIEDLGRSLLAAGMVVPIIVRAVPGGTFEIVAGERRYRAAKWAKLTEVPCDVRELDDTQVFEVQIIENSKRADLTDLEQAEMFESLQKRHGYDVEQIALKFTVSVATVYSRLKLLALCAEARAAMSDGIVPPSVAVPLARLPTHALQAKALKELKSRFSYDGDTINSREATHWLQREFSRTLKAAPFSLKDTMLVPEAGACVGCPHNTATATPGLFEDFAKGTGQTCTKISCFKDKADAAWKAVAAEAKKAGAEVLDREEGAKLYMHGNLGHGSKYVELDTPNHADPKRQPWRTFLERLPVESRPQLVVAPDKDLNRHDLCDAASLLAAIAADPGAPKWSKAEVKAKEERAGQREEEKENREKTQLRERVVSAVLGKIAEQVKALDAPLLRFIIMQLTESYVDRPTLETLEAKDHDAFDAMVKRGDVKLLLRILFLVAVGKGDAGRCEDGYSDEIKALAKSQNVDLKVIEKAIAQGDEAEALMKKKGAK